MGRIKTMMIKRITNNLVAEHRDDFKKTFEENKQIVEQFADIPSKKLRNIIAGYVTRLMKENKESMEL
ncbi:30S ribosomal protein S17e [Candidatus Woesearchaeota archaeon]|nr:30S ribosomal protein S17e [Candidatus Woesearchaeota archaeon]